MDVFQLKEILYNRGFRDIKPCCDNQALIGCILKAMEDSYNAGINDAAINVKTYKQSNAGSWYDAGIDKESINKLLIKH